MNGISKSIGRLGAFRIADNLFILSSDMKNHFVTFSAESVA
jgi:hypothetical protein